MLSAEWIDSHQKTTTRFSEKCEVPDIVHFVIYINHSQGTALLWVELKEQCLTMK